MGFGRLRTNRHHSPDRGRLCEAVDLRSNQRVLDVAAGNGNATLAAARRFAEVVSTDYVGSLLARARDRAAAERLPVTFQEADAESLPFPAESFDVVLSTFGVMFTPNQEQAASELLRVCRHGGKIGLANWTPDGLIGRLFKTTGKYVPPPAPGIKSPALWGTKAHLDALFGSQADVTVARRKATNRRGIGLSCFEPIMARCSRRSRQSIQIHARRSRAIFTPSSTISTLPKTARSSPRASGRHQKEMILPARAG